LNVNISAISDLGVSPSKKIAINPLILFMVILRSLADICVSNRDHSAGTTKVCSILLT